MVISSNDLHEENIEKETEQERHTRKLKQECEKLSA